MIVETAHTKKEFKPITLTVTFETEKEIINYLKYMREKGTKPASVDSLFNTLTSVLENEAVKQGLI